MNIRIEKWNNHEIRFVEVEPSEWWAVAKDIVEALGLKQVTRAVSSLPKDGVTTSKVGVVTGRKKNGELAIQEVEVNIIDEKSIYRLAFRSRKKEAVEFQDWVFDMLQELRKQSGIEGFEIFRMLDKEHQKETMSKLSQSLKRPKRINFIKANTIANKAISTRHGYSKMIKKDSMTPDMLIERQSILDDTVNLMSAVDRFNLELSVSEKVYDKYTN